MDLFGNDDDPRGELPDFETFDLRALPEKCTHAHFQGQYVFIADMSGKAAAFFNH